MNALVHENNAKRGQREEHRKQPKGDISIFAFNFDLYSRADPTDRALRTPPGFKVREGTVRKQKNGAEQRHGPGAPAGGEKGPRAPRVERTRSRCRSLGVGGGCAGRARGAVDWDVDWDVDWEADGAARSHARCWGPHCKPSGEAFPRAGAGGGASPLFNPSSPPPPASLNILQIPHFVVAFFSPSVRPPLFQVHTATADKGKESIQKKKKKKKNHDPRF